MSLAAALGARLRNDLVIVGIGNPLRGDDAAGSLVARSLRPAPGVTVIDAEEVPENHVGPMVAAQPRAVLLIDAVDLLAAPGSVALLEAGDLRLHEAWTHRVPLGLLMGVLARETGADVLLLAIQPRQVGLGCALSAEVETSVALVVETLDHLLEQRRSSPVAPGAGGGGA
jgi:hydrogenase 3 maturation protease